MLDKNGKLLTSDEGIKQGAMNHFKEVLGNRPIKSNLEMYQVERENLWKERIKDARANVASQWTEVQVKYVIKKNLKKKKSRDPQGIPNELIQCGGKDVNIAIMKLMNGIKRKKSFPHCLQSCNITSIYKNKGQRKILICTGECSGYQCLEISSTDLYSMMNTKQLRRI